MSRHELVDAYVSGTINRRAFVRGLTALGVSAGVAASYAVALQPAAAGNQGVPGDYDYDYDDYGTNPPDDAKSCKAKCKKKNSNGARKRCKKKCK